jgi:hypothetical protein
MNWRNFAAEGFVATLEFLLDNSGSAEQRDLYQSVTE